MPYTTMQRRVALSVLVVLTLLSLHASTFTHGSFKHTETFTHRQFYTEAFTHRHLYIHTDAFTHRWSQTPLQSFTPRRVRKDALAHRAVETWKQWRATFATTMVRQVDVGGLPSWLVWPGLEGDSWCRTIPQINWLKVVGQVDTLDQMNAVPFGRVKV